MLKSCLDEADMFEAVCQITLVDVVSLFAAGMQDGMAQCSNVSSRFTRSRVDMSHDRDGGSGDSQ